MKTNYKSKYHVKTHPLFKRPPKTNTITTIYRSEKLPKTTVKINYRSKTRDVIGSTESWYPYLLDSMSASKREERITLKKIMLKMTTLSKTLLKVRVQIIKS